MSKITGKYSSLNIPQVDDLTLTHSRRDRNTTAMKSRDGTVIFDPSMTSKTSLAECFRIFVEKGRLSHEPANRLERPIRGIELEEMTTVYTDGSCLNNGKANARAGAGIWYGPADPRNRSVRVPGQKQSNQIGELAAVVCTLQDVPPFTPLLIVTDSEYVKKGLTQWLQKWEDKGFVGVQNKEWFQAAAFLLRHRSAKTLFRWVKGHNEDVGNQGADLLAGAGANKEEVDEIDLSIPSAFDIQGAKLEELTQKIAYAGIRERKPKTERRRTRARMTTTTESMDTDDIQEVTVPDIWRGMKAGTIRPNVREFLYKVAHDTQLLGDRWADSSTPERASCTACGDGNESMEHILFECDNTTRRTLWHLAKETWVDSHHTWPNIELGKLIACGTLRFKVEPGAATKKEQRKRDRIATGASHRLQILLSETAHLIWAIRCERVIQGRVHTKRSVEGRWWSQINARLRTDRIVALKIKKKPKDLLRMASTWGPIVDKYGSHNKADAIAYDADWLTSQGVFSGYGVRPRVPHSQAPGAWG
jgi:ribonuclease HI